MSTLLLEQTFIEIVVNCMMRWWEKTKLNLSEGAERHHHLGIYLFIKWWRNELRRQSSKDSSRRDKNHCKDITVIALLIVNSKMMKSQLLKITKFSFLFNPQMFKINYFSIFRLISLNFVYVKNLQQMIFIIIQLFKLAFMRQIVASSSSKVKWDEKKNFFVSFSLTLNRHTRWMWRSDFTVKEFNDTFRARK